jgi:RHS repeat-associated protein
MDYAWLGRHQRPLEHAGTLATIEMGARQYVPGLGRFLEVDPVEGGSANDYEYCKGNPVNCEDLDGTRGRPGSSFFVVQSRTLIGESNWRTYPGLGFRYGPYYWGGLVQERTFDFIVTATQYRYIGGNRWDVIDVVVHQRSVYSRNVYGVFDPEGFQWISYTGKSRLSRSSYRVLSSRFRSSVRGPFITRRRSNLGRRR